MGDNTVVAFLGGGAALAVAWQLLRRARLSASHRRGTDAATYLAGGVVMALVAVSFVLAPGAWVDGYGGVLRVFGGG